MHDFYIYLFLLELSDCSLLIIKYLLKAHDINENKKKYFNELSLKISTPQLNIYKCIQLMLFTICEDPYTSILLIKLLIDIGHIINDEGLHYNLNTNSY